MFKNRLLLLLVAVTAFVLIPSARAHWIWSPTEGKKEGAGNPVSQPSVSASQSTHVTKAPSVPPAKEEGVAGRTAQFLKDTFRLRPVGFKKGEAAQASQAPIWVWSPSEGKFVSSAAVAVEQTAERQYLYALELRKAGKHNEAFKELRRLVRHHPDSVYAPEAQYLIATTSEEMDKPVRAASEFQKLVRDFPHSERIDAAMEHLFKIGNLFLSGEKQKVMGVGILPTNSKAVEIFKFIVSQTPYGPYGDQAQLQLGIAYRKLGNFEEAIKAFETLIANYSTSPLLDEAHYQLAETSYEYSQSASRDQKTLNQASTYLKEFIHEYGGSTLAERAGILKSRLEEQDAEKNYRIGLYYEKQGFIESAMIYYEDVADRYSHTPFGKKAAEKYQEMSQPARTLARGEEAIARRSAEVRSMLQALDEEERLKEGSAKGIPETGPLKQELQVELATLAVAQKQFGDEEYRKFGTRRKALRSREKNLREKFKIFGKRKKLLARIPSPELEEVLEKWEESLLKEQDELSKERGTLQELGVTFERETPSWLAWLPFVGGPSELPSDERVAEFKDKSWTELERERRALQKERQGYESELAAIARELSPLEYQEFEMAKTLPQFQDIIPSDLKQEKDSVDQKRAKLDETVRQFEAAKNEYASRYGGDFLKTLALDLSVKDPGSAEELIESGVNLEETLRSLQQEKMALSETWLVEKERLNTIVKAAGQTQAGLSQSAQGVASPPGSQFLSPEEQAKEARLLKKRIKYVEREIRSRLDQIGDWQYENAKRTERLEQLLHPKTQAQKVSKLLVPARGTYRLAKAFLFGLPDRDRQVVEEARETLEAPDAPLPPETLKAIRELEEEIELQSILIQGRAKEVTELERRLEELQKQAKQFPGFSYQSLLVQRFPHSLEQSLATATRLLGERDHETVFRDRVLHQTRQIERLENELGQIDQKIQAVGGAIQRSAVGKTPVPKIAANVLASIPGSTETLPSESAQGLGETDAEREAFESKLMDQRAEVVKARADYESLNAEFETALFERYRSEMREKLRSEFPPEGKALFEKHNSLAEQKREAESRLIQLVKREYEMVISQKEFLERKLAELEKRLRKVRTPADARYDALMKEIKRTADGRDLLIRDISLLESLLKK
ncbi:MAG: outer membrane protein assembly factor BamD [Candidatus Omnitrophica bacterium]|nr:outer membrane protein assembly factor BamD [Candidatus Omnitrophota bacterium]